MDETILIPSPNWFQVSVLGASQDGWLVYGGPSKSLCFLEPLDGIGTIDSKQRFTAHVFPKAHKDKIVSVDIGPEWPDKRKVITGSRDGVVKEWSIMPKERGWTINYLHCQEEHSAHQEEVVGVCYGTKTFAVSVGSCGYICKWDLNTNVVKRHTLHLKNFKPTCISCSPHKPLHLAVGTRQGVILVLDISGISAKLIFKVRGQDDEINRVSWCPQYMVNINKIQNMEKHKRKGSVNSSNRMERIRNDQVPSEALEAALAEKKEPEIKPLKDDEEEEVPEDDMFDIYKDHEANEFGHKKYEPEDILVKVKEEPKDDFLVECEKLKAEILKKKNEPEDSIESLVEAMDKACVEGDGDVADKPESTQEIQESTKEINELTQETQVPKTNNEYGHLLASIGKYGGVYIWTQTGKLLASVSVLMNIKKDQKDYKNKGINYPTLHWFKPDSLLIGDGKNQLLEVNPLNVDCKNKLVWRVVHSLHRRGLYCVSSNAPHVQTPDILAHPASDNWVVWTVGQDRNIISYSMKENKKIEVFASCGGFIFDIQSCAYDAGKIAMTVGDGSVRVWETHTTNELEDQLASGVISSFWQNVQGKVLTLAWHPSKENLLAFATAESRVGILDSGGSFEKPAKVFPSYFKQGVYALSWGVGMKLYACGNGELALFRANRMDEKGQEIRVEVDGQKWKICSVLWTPHGVLVGATNGGVAILKHINHHVITATFVFLKMIYSMAWHPQQITSSQEESKYKNYIAVCSIEKINTIVILEYEDKGDGARQFKKIGEPLAGHEGTILQVAWNPHRDGQLLSSSQDATVRIWNVLEGECIAIFGGHLISAQSAMWCTQPRLADKVLSCGGDCCVRLWDIREHPVESYKVVRKEVYRKKSKMHRAREEKRREAYHENTEEVIETKNPTQNAEKTDSGTAVASTSENIATKIGLKLVGLKAFLLPNSARQVGKGIELAKKIIDRYIEENNRIDMQDVIKTYVPKEYGLEFLKLFGTMNELNELLDMEAKYHLKAKDWEAYLMLLFYRGKVDDMIQFASENDLLDPYLLSLSPTVSFKYWKDTTQLYLSQLDRMAAKGQEDRFCVYRFYGGILYRKASALLCMHNLKACIEVLTQSSLYKEAYMICRLRHMDSIAEEVLLMWADASSDSGALMMAAILHLVRGDISEAAMVVGRSNQICYLKLAHKLAKLAGHSTFATALEARVQEIEIESEEELEKLPTRVEALLNLNESESENEKLSEEIDIGIAKAMDGNGIDGKEVENITPATNEKVLFDVAIANVEDIQGDKTVNFNGVGATLNGTPPATINGKVIVEAVDSAKVEDIDSKEIKE